MYLLLRYTSFLLSGAGFFLLFLISRTSIFDLVREAGASFFAAAIGGYLVLLLMGMLFLGHGHPLRSRLRFFPLLATLWFSGYGIFLYSDQPLVLLLLMILLPVLTWMWLENLYLFLQRPFAYQAYSLPRIARFLYVVALFLLAAFLIGFQILVQWPAWLVYTSFCTLVLWLQIDYFLLQQISIRESILYALFGTILHGQLILVLHLLPTHFFLYGLLTSLFFYSWFGIMTQVLSRKQDEIVKVPYVVFSGLGATIGLVLVLFVR